MRKLFLQTTIALLSTIGMTSAQTFNKTYNAPNMDRHQAYCVVPAANESEDYMFFTSAAGTSYAVENTLLTKADANGVPLKTIFFPSLIMSWNHRIIEANDGGVLMAGQPMYYAGGGGFGLTDSLKIYKYDANLNLEWSRVVLDVHAGSATNGGIDIERFTVVNEEGAEEENFIIVFSMDDDPGNPNDIQPAALRITENGSLVWHKKYRDANRGQLSDPFIYDWSCRIAKMGEDDKHGQLFALAGERASTEASFYTMVIDAAGNIIEPYTRVFPGFVQAGGPLGIDVTWDGDELVYSYIAVNPGIGAGVPSAFGFIKLTPDLTTITNHRIYYAYCENYPNSIEMTNDGNYMVSGWTHHGCVTGVANPMLLKLDQSLQPQFFHVFNFNVYSQNLGYHRTSLNTGYSYLPVTRENNSFTSPFSSWRIIKADANGEACGYEVPDLNEWSLEPNLATREYRIVSFDRIYEFAFQYSLPEIPYTDCDDFVENQNGDPANYKLAQSDKSEAMEISIAPTLVNMQEPIYCTINKAKETKLHIVIVNSMGQLVYTREEKVQTGSNTIAINGNVMSSGLNMVRVMKGDKVLKTVKVMCRR